MENQSTVNETSDVEVETDAKAKTEENTDEQVDAQAETQSEGEDNVEELKPEAKVEEDFKEKYYYLAAEMQNMQRRFDKEKESLLKYGSEKILKDLLDVADNFERTLGFIKTDEDKKVQNIVVGVDMINKQLMDALSKHGLKQVDAIGKQFDPNFHEALAQQPAEGKEEMEILEVHAHGYTLNDRLVRPAKVIVVKNEKK